MSSSADCAARGHPSDELLRRAGLTHGRHPWMVENLSGHWSIDYAKLRQQAHTLDLSEEAVARIAVALATGERLDLRTALSYLTRDHAALVITAIAYASGHDRESSRITLRDGTRHIETAAPLSQWT